MIGFYLDPDTNDLALDANGALRMARDAEAVSQHAKQRVLSHEGEWFLDTTAGLPWLDRVMGQPFDASVLEALVVAEIADTPGVVEVDGASVSFDRNTRGANVRGFSVSTIYDEV